MVVYTQADLNWANQASRDELVPWLSARGVQLDSRPRAIELRAQARVWITAQMEAASMFDDVVFEPAQMSDPYRRSQEGEVAVRNSPRRTPLVSESVHGSPRSSLQGRSSPHISSDEGSVHSHRSGGSNRSDRRQEPRSRDGRAPAETAGEGSDADRNQVEGPPPRDRV